MSPKERIDKIMELLEKNKYLSLKTLSELMFISISTIRRDVIEMERSGLVKRNRGAISLSSNRNNEYSYLFRDVEHIEEKNYICELALDFIHDGFSLFLDASTTVNRICHKLKNNKSNLTIITNGLKTALELNELENSKIFIAGGLLKTRSGSVITEMASNFIDNFSADLSIISCAGIDEKGIYESDHSQALVKQHFVKNSKRTILLCNSSKFNSSHYYRLVDFKNVFAVITDKEPDKDIFDSLSENNCKVLF